MHRTIENYRDAIGDWNTFYIGDVVTLMGEDAIQSVCISCQFDDHDNLILSTDELVSDFTAAGGTVAPGRQSAARGPGSVLCRPVSVSGGL